MTDPDRLENYRDAREVHVSNLHHAVTMLKCPFYEEATRFVDARNSPSTTGATCQNGCWNLQICIEDEPEGGTWAIEATIDAANAHSMEKAITKELNK